MRHSGNENKENDQLEDDVLYNEFSQVKSMNLEEC